MPLSDEASNVAVEAARNWYESKRSKKGHVNFNVMAVGLAVASFLRSGFPISEAIVTADEGAQVRGLNAAFIRRILDRAGVIGKIPAEGGRTSRGSLKKAIELSNALNETLAFLKPGYLECTLAADALESYFVECVQSDYFNKQKLDVDIEASKPVSLIVSDIIAATQQRSDKPAGTVVQHLVGAKLELRFPGFEIGRDKANAADQQTNRQGDFQLGSTAFHVTMSPMAKLQDRVRGNLREGYRPVVLVPESQVDFARGLFQSEPDLQGRVGVQSVETFIGTNVEEMADYDSGQLRREIALLIRTYNERIEESEADMSLRIVEPQWAVSLLS